jgi:hypothetical protein
MSILLFVMILFLFNSSKIYKKLQQVNFFANEEVGVCAKKFEDGSRYGNRRISKRVESQHYQHYQHSHFANNG